MRVREGGLGEKERARASERAGRMDGWIDRQYIMVCQSRGNTAVGTLWGSSMLSVSGGVLLCSSSARTSSSVLPSISASVCAKKLLRSTG